MNAKLLKEIISKGEGTNIEFKESRNKLNRDVFESVCAFLNRNGGHLVLGVKNDRCVVGIDPDSLKKVIDEFITSSNNPQKLNPPFYFLPEVITINKKKVIYISIPESSQVHRTAGKIYDRNEDGDFNITNNSELVTQLFLRKQTTYSENRIYSYVSIEDLREDLFLKIHKLASNQRPNHPWMEMDNLELLKSSRLFKKDYKTGEEGFTLAAVLLLGKDKVIQSILPYYRTDAILRVKNTDRYDDRDDIRTNLIESYDRLMAFVAKHLPDSFHIEKDQRISLRDKIFREITVNILIHREFMNAFPAKFIIENNCVLTENSNKPHGSGLIDPQSFSPYPKNPIIANFFKEIGLADELGSGIKNSFKYCQLYAENRKPEFEEGDIFKTIIPITPQVTPQVTTQVTTQVEDIRITNIIKFCKVPKSRNEIQKYIGIKNREYFRKQYLNPLIKKELLKLTIPDKPNSPKQKYYSDI